MKNNEQGAPLHREPGQMVAEAYRQRGELRYTAEGRSIIGRNGSYFNNRPLYCEPAQEGVVLAGDRPFIRLIAKGYVHGAFYLGWLRGDAGQWLHDFAEVEARYHCGRMTWVVTDPQWPGVSLTFNAMPAATGAGAALRLQVNGGRAGDRLVWVFGGARPEDRTVTSWQNIRWDWDPVMRGNPKIFKTGDPRRAEIGMGPIPDWSLNNVIHLEDACFRLSATAEAAHGVVGRVDRAGNVRVGDASASGSPLKLTTSSPAERPIITGVVDLDARAEEIHWGLEVVETSKKAGPTLAPAELFQKAAQNLDAMERVKTETPDARLDAAVAAVCHAVEASCVRDPFIFRHGCMAFNIPFLGWRVICGATALGWHERVKGNAAYYVESQITADDKRIKADASPHVLLCHQGPDSRFYGVGWVKRDQSMFNAQSQFFDQTISAWRWTADPELEKFLRPALELQLKWAQECFDPDGDGLYESYINVLPTDCVWYNGGGSVEESAYAYTAHLAARDMARRAGDLAGEKRHEAQARKIQQALMSVLWLKDRGHFGLYVEQGGHRRLHHDAWVYSQFLPIDAALLPVQEALQALYYTEWALERIPMPFGGELCQPSNWVPSVWSVRDMFGGDIFHLALAYFQTGLGDEGWKLLQGGLLETAYASVVPGGFTHIGAGTDFADNVHMFARVVVQGLFGFEPDYPSGRVRIQPAFPAHWPKAAIKTPDYELSYERQDGADLYRISIAKEAEMKLRLAVRAAKVEGITLNGKEVTWSVEPGCGCTWLIMETAKLKEALVRIKLADRLTSAPPSHLEGEAGETVSVNSPHGKITRLTDCHDVLSHVEISPAGLKGRLTPKPGHHLALAEISVGDLPQWHLCKIKITDSSAESARQAKSPRQATAGGSWHCLDLAPHYNGDVRTIFQQQYLSPRPDTCSVQIGTNGYSPWCFPHWGYQPPVIDLANVDQLSIGERQIRTPQGAIFTRFGAERNIAFTSLWDNWPTSVAVPVDQSADSAWLLVCGSTFPMQTRIENAEFRFEYADGVVEKLPLVPPDNFWTLCPLGGIDYSYETDAFALPAEPPPQVQLGQNCRAMVLSWKLRAGVPLRQISLETLSQDVVIGLMGVSLFTKA